MEMRILGIKTVAFSSYSFTLQTVRDRRGRRLLIRIFRKGNAMQRGILVLGSIGLVVIGIATIRLAMGDEPVANDQTLLYTGYVPLIIASFGQVLLFASRAFKQPPTSDW